MKTGDPKGALTPCERAMAKGMDVDYVRGHCFQAAWALQATAMIQAKFLVGVRNEVKELQTAFFVQ